MYVSGQLLISSFQTGDPSWSWETICNQIGPNITFLQGTLSDAPEQVYAEWNQGVFSWSVMSMRILLVFAETHHRPFSLP
jgi:hypothetical protein